ncbi:unnamed protein product, partial [Didymodactylos carnosus]
KALDKTRILATNFTVAGEVELLDDDLEVDEDNVFYDDEFDSVKKTVVCPIIDVLTWNAFELLQGATDIFGTFGWKMIFRWSKITNKNYDHNDHSKPVR